MGDGQPASVRVGGPDSVRRRNLSELLRLAHTAGPVARAALTRITGLNRSTVGALVGELESLGLVLESEPGADGRVGRPSPVVTANPRVVSVAVNPEIDAITVGFVGLGGVVHRRIRVETDRIPSAADAVEIVLSVLEDHSGELAAFDRVTGVGVAVPGLVRDTDGLVRLAPHLEWTDEPIARMLREATGLPVHAANDARLGANAERLFGAGRSSAHLVYVNGGASGIGGGFVVGGVPLSGAGGYAGEIGHTLVNSAGVRCHCGASGCLETEVSQAALRRALGVDASDPAELEAALLGDRSARAAGEVERQLGFLAVALRTAVNVFNPERIVLGGFLASLTEYAPGRLTALVSGQALPAADEAVRIVRSALGADRLMVGAAETAFSVLLADPAAPPPGRND